MQYTIIDGLLSGKQGEPRAIVVPLDRVGGRFSDLADSCKAAGGAYSHKAQGQAWGFAFLTREDAQAWADKELVMRNEWIFKDTPLPVEATEEHARDLAIEMGCTHITTSSFFDRDEEEHVKVATYFGSLHPTMKDRFIEAFHVGLDWKKSGLRMVHDFRHLELGGREWHPDILAAHGELLSLLPGVIT